jgi:hypothetical protein
VTDNSWLGQLRRNLVTNGKFSGPQMEHGTSCDFRSEFGRRLIQSVASATWQNCHVALATTTIQIALSRPLALFLRSNSDCCILRVQ